jgi:hypothetical protein
MGILREFKKKRWLAVLVGGGSGSGKAFGHTSNLLF